MIRYGNAGWQTTMADLSLILFIVALAALVQQAEQDGTPPNSQAVFEDSSSSSGVSATQTPILPAVLPAEAEAVALYRPGKSVPDLKVWLREQSGDPRLQLTILARYTQQGGAAVASSAAMALAQDAQQAGFSPRIVLEPSATADVAAVLSYDRATATP